MNLKHLRNLPHRYESSRFLIAAPIADTGVDPATRTSEGWSHSGKPFIPTEVVLGGYGKRFFHDDEPEVNSYKAFLVGTNVRKDGTPGSLEMSCEIPLDEIPDADKAAMLKAYAWEKRERAHRLIAEAVALEEDAHRWSP